jgi:hypothetical protein
VAVQGVAGRPAKFLTHDTGQGTRARFAGLTVGQRHQPYVIRQCQVCKGVVSSIERFGAFVAQGTTGPRPISLGSLYISYVEYEYG